MAATGAKVILRHCDAYDAERIRGIVREGLEELELRPTGRTLVKPNLVIALKGLFDHAFTRSEFLDGVLGALRDRAADDLEELAVGERCGITMPTRLAYRGAGYPRVVRKHGAKRKLQPDADDCMGPLTLVFGAYDGPIEPRDGEKVVFMGDLLPLESSADRTWRSRVATSTELALPRRSQALPCLHPRPSARYFTCEGVRVDVRRPREQHPRHGYHDAHTRAGMRAPTTRYAQQWSTARITEPRPNAPAHHRAPHHERHHGIHPQATAQASLRNAPIPIVTATGALRLEGVTHTARP